MLLSGQAHTVFPGEGEVGDLGIVQMRALAAGESTTNRSFSLLEFSGAQGPWTVPHIHQGMEESFYVLEGEFTFAVGDEKIPTEPGAYILVPRGTPHSHRNSGASPVRMLDIFTPGGFEGWFAAYAATQDPEERTAINQQFGIEFLE